MTATKLEWQRVSNYCIRAGQYRIAKVVLGGDEWFELHAGEEHLGMWRGNAAAAKRAAQKHNDGLKG
ncbi:hypothetical protein [Halomonas salipaludis]|uniref:Uncharacterized protein n=1 Tax=Halomonas salipaludis TaxID=2032625 RepID=A0A2A2F2Q5_9GAMM|nr:hypothetical protein [Halomonas salipaludis]PAU79208.1 hypothetical protein CK498_02235 [Halomonas salipaludis]